MNFDAGASSLLIIDSSVWIDYFNGTSTPSVQLLEQALTTRRVGLGDLILAEVLQGFADSREFAAAETGLCALPIINMGGRDTALQAVRSYRALRRRGITIRGLIDCLIATAVIAGNHILLHNDRDFDHFEAHFGLQVLHP